jgi:hypothetical protein
LVWFKRSKDDLGGRGAGGCQGSLSIPLKCHQLKAAELAKRKHKINTIKMPLKNLTILQHCKAKTRPLREWKILE